MKRLFVLTPEAKNDLREILLDIAEDSPDTAERLRHEFYKGFNGLGRVPALATSTMNFLVESIASGTFIRTLWPTPGTLNRFK